jgi:hypothetical protein
MALDWSRILSGVGQGLMQAGQPGANLGHFGSGLMQGTQAYDAGVDRKEDRAFRQWQQEQAKAQAEEQRLANTKAAAEEKAIQDLINGVGQNGLMQPARQVGNYGAGVGGIQTASGTPGAGPMQGGQQFFDPATLAKLRALPPSLQRAAVEQQLGNMFATPKDNWEIKTIREGDQDVTYRIDPTTGTKEKLGSGLAFKPGKDGGNSLSISAPVWGVDKDGNTVLLQMSGDGTAVQTTLPPGVTPVRPNVAVDTGTGTAMVSPVTGQASNVIPKDIKGKESAEVQGAAEGQAIVDLPGALAKADEARKQISKLKEHPGRGYATGKSSYLPIVGGTASKDFEVLLNQAKGGVFLQAYTQLKGGGAITQIEGEKAEQAIARMDRAQTEEQFLAALDEYDSVIAAGMERLKARAGQGGTPYAAPSGDIPPPPPGFVVQ